MSPVGETKLKQQKMSQEKQKLSDITVDDLKNIMKENKVEILEGLAKVTDEIRQLKTQNEYLMHEIDLLKMERDKDRKRIAMLEAQIKGKNLIFKGLNSQKSAKDEVNKICKEVLKIEDTSGIKSTRKLFERDGKMTVLVEFQFEENITEVISKTNMLKGTAIYIERDLDAEKQQNKVVLLQLRREVQNMSRKYPIIVRDDRMKINGKWFKFDKNKNLLCGNQDGLIILKELYDNDFNIDVSYNVLFNKLNLKN